MSEENKIKKIICLFYPPLINIFDFLLPVNESTKVFEYKKNSKINHFLSTIEVEGKYDKLILLNYPQVNEELNDLQSELVKLGQKVTHLIVLSLANYDLLTEIQGNYLICPLCQEIFDQKLVSKRENDNFFCPRDGSLINRKKSNELGKKLLDNYFEKSKIIIEKLIANKNKEQVPLVNKLIIEKNEESERRKIYRELREIINE